MKNKKIIYGLILMLLFSLLISGCSSKSGAPYDTPVSSNKFTSQEERAFDEVAFEESSSDDLGSQEGPMEPDKIITTVSIAMQTKEFMATTDKLNSLIKKHKGYIEQSNISYNNYINNTRLKYSDYSIRIPRENLETFIDELKEIGNVISENKNKQDITKQYRDTESRLRILETKEERILALLEKADKMEDIIALEDQLSNIIYDKENLTANILHMDDKVDYGTIFFLLEEVAILTTGESIETSFLDKIKNAFSSSFYFFTNGVKDFIIFLIYFFPYLIIILLILFVIFKFRKKRKGKLGKKADKKADKEADKEE